MTRKRGTAIEGGAHRFARRRLWRRQQRAGNDATERAIRWLEANVHVTSPRPRPPRRRHRATTAPALRRRRQQPLRRRPRQPPRRRPLRPAPTAPPPTLPENVTELDPETTSDINPQPRDSLQQGGTLRLYVASLAENWNPDHPDGNELDFREVRRPDGRTCRGCSDAEGNADAQPRLRARTSQTPTIRSR